MHAYETFEPLENTCTGKDLGEKVGDLKVGRNKLKVCSMDCIVVVEHRKQPFEVNPMSPTNTFEGHGFLFLHNFDHRFIIFEAQGWEIGQIFVLSKAHEGFLTITFHVIENIK